LAIALYLLGIERAGQAIVQQVFSFSYHRHYHRKSLRHIYKTFVAYNTL
jgi:hypothetical protein